MNHAAGGPLIDHQQGFEDDKVEQQRPTGEKHEALHMVRLRAARASFFGDVSKDSLIQTKIVQPLRMELVAAIADRRRGFNDQTNVEFFSIQSAERGA